MRCVYRVLAVIGLNLCAMQFSSAQDLQNQAAYYIEKYGRAAPSAPLNQRAQAVFERVQAVADKHQQRFPYLVIIKNTRDPLALALPDGSVILSQQAIQDSYHKVSETQGDTRLAFILGHELAHLANNHFWHREVLQFADNTALKQALGNNAAQIQQQELEADDAGFLYAALAGYPVDKLVEDAAQERGFFSAWQQQRLQAVTSSHPEVSVRVALLHERLSHLLDKVAFFHFGVRLSHFNRCEDALYFFKAFQQVFPSREVLNNLGGCYLKLAQRELGGDAWTFWLPVQLAVNSLADELSLPESPIKRGVSRGQLSSTARHYLSQAQQALNQATQADPFFAPAWVNLAITAWYQNDVFIARAAVEKARQLLPDDQEIAALRAIIIHAEGLGTDTWPQAVQLLQELAQQADASALVLYNTAKLLEQRGRTAALPYWQQLAQKAAQLPVPIQQYVCEQTHCEKTQTVSSNAAKTWQAPITAGVYVKRDASAQALLNTWHAVPFDWQKALYGTVYQAPDQHAEVLELAGYAEMVVLKQPKISVSALAQYCGNQLRTDKFIQATVLSCQHWSALVQADSVQQVWLVAK